MREEVEDEFKLIWQKEYRLIPYEQTFTYDGTEKRLGRQNEYRTSLTEYGPMNIFMYGETSSEQD